MASVPPSDSAPPKKPARGLRGSAEAIQQRRDVIIEAAKTVFARHGIRAASLRKIAEAAGATTGAIFTYYDSKSGLYADVLCDSMAALSDRIQVVRAAHPRGERGAAVLHTVLDFYQERPHDFDLSFYLFHGQQPAGLGRELDRKLNVQMRQIIEQVADTLTGDGIDAGQEVFTLGLSAMAHVFGVVLMAKTGRLRTLRQDPHELLDLYVAMATSRAPGPLSSNPRDGASTNASE